MFHHFTTPTILQVNQLLSVF